MFDVLISGGQSIDGSGNVGFHDSVAVEGDTVQVLRGDVSEMQAAWTIDATGRIICPSFIDFHAHSGLVILSEPRHEPKVHQGIITDSRIGSWTRSGKPSTSAADPASPRTGT